MICDPIIKVICDVEGCSESIELDMVLDYEGWGFESDPEIMLDDKGWKMISSVNNDICLCPKHKDNYKL